ncbi:hypothetical protein EUTSA_v10006467mg [Eutrema salsugineum]|uniref:MATH domain-containing protein n=1 Tax=Eutrema salsugineum TaxID=72664 RepID=V4NDX1_EUTSA|nr:MATH domain and coiled-coil domain-containing protein At3g58200 [Eutrema salsugineum]ESQ44251.1 hypothetical protein EUTSA_v10006467mg [Eutrema salsugineum]
MVNKFTWVIKNFASLQSEHIYSDKFVIGGCSWRLLAYPKGDSGKSCLPLYLVVADSKTLPSGWRRHTKFSLSIVNQISERLSQVKKAHQWFDQKSHALGYSAMLPLSQLLAKDGGFLVNGEVKIVAEVEVLEVIGNVDEYEEANQPIKRIKLEDNYAVSTVLLNQNSPIKEDIDVDGFQVFPSQAEFVTRVFKKYPDIALELRAKTKTVRTAYVHVFLSLIETLCKSVQELSNDDLMEADNALKYLRYSGIKVDCLEQKVEEVKEKKKEEQTGETRIQELEEELKDLKRKCTDLETLLGEEEAKVLAARAPVLTLDVV